jgi:hypothetical protein
MVPLPLFGRAEGGSNEEATSASGPFETSSYVRYLIAIGGKADVPERVGAAVRNRGRRLHLGGCCRQCRAVRLLAREN